jgi:hypothetical protein
VRRLRNVDMAEFEKAVPEHWLAVLAILQFGA